MSKPIARRRSATRVTPGTDKPMRQFICAGEYGSRRAGKGDFRVSHDVDGLGQTRRFIHAVGYEQNRAAGLFMIIINLI